MCIHRQVWKPNQSPQAGHARSVFFPAALHDPAGSLQVGIMLVGEGLANEVARKEWKAKQWRCWRGGGIFSAVQRQLCAFTLFQIWLNDHSENCGFQSRVLQEYAGYRAIAWPGQNFVYWRIIKLSPDLFPKHISSIAPPSRLVKSTSYSAGRIGPDAGEIWQLNVTAAGFSEETLRNLRRELRGLCKKMEIFPTHRSFLSAVCLLEQ